MKILRIAPVVILVFLLIAWFVRWDYVGTKTYELGVIKWKTDRWTGYTWMNVYCTGGTYGFTTYETNCIERPASNNKQYYDAAWQQRKTATNIWYGLVSADIIWIIAVWLILPIRNKRKLEKAEIEQ